MASDHIQNGDIVDSELSIPSLHGQTQEQNDIQQQNNAIIAANSQTNASHEQITKGWNVWKSRQVSLGNETRKLSSVDPSLKPEGLLPESIEVQSEIQQQPRQQLRQQPQQQLQEQSQWYTYLNPWSYLPEETFNFQLPDNLRHEHRDSHSTQSAHSILTSSSQANATGWFLWPNFLSPAKKIIEPQSHENLDSIELKKNIKDAKKSIGNTDSVWAWYQNHFNNNISGELSVLSTKTETNPVELHKYPAGCHVPPYHQSAVYPLFQNCFRQITTKTKIRLATEIYYNYPTEKHLYIKTHTHKPLIQYILIICVNNSARKPSANAFQLTELATEAVKNWYTDKETTFDYQIETVSLEASKITGNTLEDLFKLLINWRENFKRIDYVLVAGLRITVPVAASLLDILISRNLFERIKKTGLLLMDGNIANPYLEPIELDDTAYSAQFDTTIAKLIRSYNTKVNFVGSLSNIPSTLALHLSHPNIFRSVLLPDNDYDDEFETHLFNIMLTASNLGHPSSRLLIQISKYFISQPNGSPISPAFTECLNSNVFQNAIDNSLSSTSLIQKQDVKVEIISDPILDNNYNMVWTLHAFIDDYRKIKNIDSYQSVLQLLSLYKKWNPPSKNLKDLKYMLEVLQIDDYSGTILRPI